MFLKNLSVVKDYFRFREQIRSVNRVIGFYDRLLLYRYFFEWRYYKKRSDSLKEQIPWITFRSISFLKKYLKKKMVVFEYGSGGSSLFLSKRVSKLYSIEHNKVWHAKVEASIIKNGIKNVQLILQEPEILNPLDDTRYKSDVEEYKNHTFKSYVKTIDAFPDEYFDLIIIDGRARRACFEHSLKKIKPTGFILFDNTNRVVYHDAFRGFERLDFWGPVPFNSSFTMTSIILLPKKID